MLHLAPCRHLKEQKVFQLRKSRLPRRFYHFHRLRYIVDFYRALIVTVVEVLDWLNANCIFPKDCKANMSIFLPGVFAAWEDWEKQLIYAKEWKFHLVWKLHRKAPGPYASNMMPYYWIVRAARQHLPWIRSAWLVFHLRKIEDEKNIRIPPGILGTRHCSYILFSLCWGKISNFSHQ